MAGVTDEMAGQTAAFVETKNKPCITSGEKSYILSVALVLTLRSMLSIVESKEASAFQRLGALFEALPCINGMKSLTGTIYIRL